MSICIAMLYVRDSYKLVRVRSAYVAAVFCTFVRLSGARGFYEAFLDWKSVCEVSGICTDFTYKVSTVFCSS